MTVKNGTSEPGVRGMVRRVLPPVLYAAIGRTIVRPARGAWRALPGGLKRARRLLFRRYRYPGCLSIFLTTRCNLQCFICNRENFKGEDIDFEKLSCLKRAIKFADVVDLTGWGEPFLYPKFYEALDFIYGLNPKHGLIRITTNGTKLTARAASSLNGHLRGVVISLNAATAATYNRDMKGGDFDKTLVCIVEFMDALGEAETGKVALHFVAHRENYHEMAEFVRLARSLHVPKVTIGNYLVERPKRLAYSLVNLKDQYNTQVDEAQQTAEELGVDFQARRFFDAGRQVPRTCRYPFTDCFITTKGEAVPCCFCGDYSMGNVFDVGFEKVWFSSAYGRLRKQRYLPACQRCVYALPFDDERCHMTEPLKSVYVRQKRRKG